MKFVWSVKPTNRAIRRYFGVQNHHCDDDDFWCARRFDGVERSLRRTRPSEFGAPAGVGFMGIAIGVDGGAITRSAWCWLRFCSGALTQGGSEMQFEMPQVSREFNVVIQGLVIFLRRRFGWIGS